MARIEASKVLFPPPELPENTADAAYQEATRASNILDLVNGTQWAQVTLEPKDW